MREVCREKMVTSDQPAKVKHRDNLPPLDCCHCAVLQPRSAHARMSENAQVTKTLAKFTKLVAEQVPSSGSGGSWQRAH